MTMVFENIANSDVLVYIFVIFLIVVSMMMIYLVYNQNKQLTEELMTRDKHLRDNKNNNQELDLKSLTKELEAAPKEKNIELTKYEAEQEEKAIISYEELVNANKNLSINYSDTDELDNIVVKKVDLDNTGKYNINEITAELDRTKEENQPIKVEEVEPISIPVATYDHEEEFLENLKQVQSSIN